MSEPLPELLSASQVEELMLAILNGSGEPLEREEIIRRTTIVANWAESVLREDAMLRLILDGSVVIEFTPGSDDFVYVPVRSNP